MRIMIFLAAAAVLILSGCNQNGSTKTTSSGYEYTVHTDAQGQKPQPGDYVYFHAQIRKADSVIYKTREQSPEPPFFQIPTAEVAGRKPSPIEDVLAVITVGDSATIHVPLDSLPQRPPGFEGVEEIIYDVVIVDLKSETDFQAYQQELQQKAEVRTTEVSELVAQTIQQYQAGALTDQIQTTATGLKYIIHEQGDGAPAEPGKLVSVDYYGVLADGESFDNSYQRGQAFPFPLGQGRVIPGWDEGIDLLNEGGKATLFIPGNLGYGAAGSPPVIPPDAELIFYVDLVDVQDMQ